ncbi:hypothetical protein VYU27_003925 [Nannochloropsis oceanica]
MMLMCPTVDVPLRGEVVGLGLVVGIGAIFIFFPLLLRFLPGLRRALPMHYTPLSDIPGCPEHYDEALICALCTLPDPNNFLTVYSYLPLDDGVSFRHPKMPKCRYFSISLYAGLYDPVQDKVPPSSCDHELAYNEDGSFDVAICDEEDRPADIPKSNWLPRQGVRDGLFVVRRYGTLPGQRIDMPSFWTMHANKPRQIKPTYRSFSGAQYAEKAPGHRYNRLLTLLKYFGVVYAILLFVGRWTVAEVNVVILVAAALPAGLLQVLYVKGLNRAKKMCDKQTQGKLHEFLDPTSLLTYDAESAKAHPEHRYYCCIYDANQGDIVITGHFFPGQQKMWTFVVYAENGLPHHHNFNDETITSTSTDTIFPSSKNGQIGRGGGGDGSLTALSYRVVLTKDPLRMPQGRENVVDVSKLPRGAVILRLIYPNTKEIFDQSKPDVKVVSVQKGSCKKEA